MLEARRMLGGALFRQAKGIREVARLLGVTPTSVLRWEQAFEEGGLETLKAKPHPGRRLVLPAKQKEASEATLRQDPLAAGFARDLWTLDRVARVIQMHFGVKYHLAHVWRTLRGPGWIPQKPERRARERDEDAIPPGGTRRDRRSKSPGPRLERRPDGESGSVLQPAVRRTHAPHGQTPVQSSGAGGGDCP